MELGPRPWPTGEHERAAIGLVARPAVARADRAWAVRSAHAVFDHRAPAEPIAGCGRRRSRAAGGLSGWPHVLFRAGLPRCLPGCRRRIVPRTVKHGGAE